MNNDDIKQHLTRFFPDTAYNDEKIATDLEKKEIIADPDLILPFLQTALFDDKILEVELDNMPRVYFSRLKDHIPEPIVEEIDGKMVHTEPNYEKGGYLLDRTQLVSLPLEPGMGNLHLRQSQTIVLRMFTSNYAVEFGTTFFDLIKVREMPVLQLAYPVIMRKVRNAREFRAKAPESLDFIASITLDNEDDDTLNTTPIDISVTGMALAVTKQEQKFFQQGQKYNIKLYIDDELLVVVDTTVKHLAKVRKRYSIEYLCGVEFDLDNQIVKSAIESIVATVQRAHLKELAEKSDASGFDLIA